MTPKKHYTLKSFLRHLLTPLGGGVPPDLAAIDRAIGWADKFLTRQIASAEAKDALLSQSLLRLKTRRVRCGAAFLAQVAEAKRKSGGTLDITSREALDKALQRAAHRYIVFACVARDLSLTADQLQADSRHYLRTRRLTDAFGYAVFPRRLEVMVRQASIDTRVRTYVTRARFPLSDTARHAVKVFLRVMGRKKRREAWDLLRTIGIRRIYTYSDAELCDSATQHIDWNGIRAYLIERKAGKRNPAYEQWIMHELEHRIARLTLRKTGYRAKRQQVLIAALQAMAHIDDPELGFYYHLDFHTWCSALAALFLARDRRAGAKVVPGLPFEPAGHALVVSDALEKREAQAVDFCWLKFLSLDFPETNGANDRVWSMTVLRALCEAAMTDENLSAIIELSSGVVVSAPSLAVCRFRLERRRRVIHVILKSPRRDAPEPIEVWLERFGGAMKSVGAGASAAAASLARVDHALRRVVVSALIARIDHDGLLVWATACCVAAAASGDPTAQVQRVVAAMIRTWCAAGGSATGLIAPTVCADRISRLSGWYRSNPAKADAARNLAAQLNMADLAGPALYLIHVLQLTPAEAAGMLNFSSAARAADWERILRAVA